MPALALALVVLTTVANAVALVLQRTAAQDAAREGGPATVRALARHSAQDAGPPVGAPT